MFRDNELVDVPQELGELQGLRELHLQVHFRELSVLWKQILYLINLNLADCNQTAPPPFSLHPDHLPPRDDHHPGKHGRQYCLPTEEKN